MGLTRVFALMDGQSMETLRQLNFFDRLERLVLDLNTTIPSLLKQSAMLRGLNKRRWPDLIARLFATNMEEELSLSVSVPCPPKPLNQKPPCPCPDVDKAISRLEAVEVAAIFPDHSTHEVIRSGTFVTDFK